MTDMNFLPSQSHMYYFKSFKMSICIAFLLFWLKSYWRLIPQLKKSKFYEKNPQNSTFYSIFKFLIPKCLQNHWLLIKNTFKNLSEINIPKIEKKIGWSQSWKSPNITKKIPKNSIFICLSKLWFQNLRKYKQFTKNMKHFSEGVKGR